MKYRIGETVWIFNGGRRAHRGVMCSDKPVKERCGVEVDNTLYLCHVSTIYKSKRAALGKAVKIIKKGILYHEKMLLKLQRELDEVEERRNEKGVRDEQRRLLPGMLG